MSRLSGQTRANSQQDLTFFFPTAAAAEPEEQVKLALLLLLTKMKIGCFYKYDRQRGLAPSLSCSLPRSAKEAESLKRCGGGGAFLCVSTSEATLWLPLSGLLFLLAGSTKHFNLGFSQ